MTNKLGIKAKVFIYYLQNTTRGKAISKMFLPMRDEESVKYMDAAREKLIEKFGEEFVKSQEWAIHSEARCMAMEEIEDATKWLVENGYLYRKKYNKPGLSDEIKVVYTGVTDKGWAIAPKYLALTETT